MSILDSIEVPKDGAFVATVTGDAGVGKTTFAATFPKPLFIRAEDGLQAIPKEERPPALPVIAHPDELWEQLEACVMAAMEGSFDYETVVIDSTSQLETLFSQYIVESDHRNPKSIAQAGGGYGAGYVQLADMHRRVRKAAELLKGVGVNVVFICHSDVVTLELPDKDPYNRYELRLHKKCVPHYVDNVDLVGYLRLETFTTGDGERKKAKSTGKRELICFTDAAQVSKNRFGITKPLIVPHGENPLYDIIPVLK